MLYFTQHSFNENVLFKKVIDGEARIEVTSRRFSTLKTINHSSE